MDSEEAADDKSFYLPSDQLDLMESIERILVRSPTGNHIGAIPPNVRYTHHESNLPRTDSRPGSAESAEPGLSSEWEYDAKSIYAKYIDKNSPNAIDDTIAAKPHEPCMSPARRMVPKLSTETIASHYSAANGTQDKLTTKPPANQTVSLNELYSRTPLPGYRSKISLVQTSRAATPEPRATSVRLHSSKGEICDVTPSSPDLELSFETGDESCFAHTHKETSTARLQNLLETGNGHRESVLSSRTFPSSNGRHRFTGIQHTQTVMQASGDGTDRSYRESRTTRVQPVVSKCFSDTLEWTAAKDVSALPPKPQWCPPSPGVPYVPKADRILGETRFTRTQAQTFSAINNPIRFNQDQHCVVSQLLSSPLPRISRRNQSDREDIESFVASPTLTQRIRLNGHGRVVSFSVVGPADGHPVILYPGVGYTRFVSIFMQETAILLNFRLITIDSPGQGFSDKLSAGLESDTAHVAATVLEALSIDRFSVIAHATGAMNALELARGLPDRIVGPITLLSPFVFKHQRTAISFSGNIQKTSIFEKFSPLKPRLLTAHTHDIRPHRPKTLSAWSSEKQFERPSDFEERLAEIIWQLATSPTNSRYLLKLQFSGQERIMVGDLLTEFKILHQIKDLKTPIQLARNLCAMLPNSSLIELPAGEKSDLLVNPLVMAEVLESLKRRLEFRTNCDV